MTEDSKKENETEDSKKENETEDSEKENETEDSEKEDATKWDRISAIAIAEWDRFLIAIAETCESFAGGLLGGVTIAFATGNTEMIGRPLVAGASLILLVIFIFYVGDWVRESTGRAYD